MKKCGCIAALTLTLSGSASTAPAAGDREPIIHTLRVPAPDSHYLEVEVIVPAAGRDQVELAMAVWSPGFYKVEDHAARIESLAAWDDHGLSLELEKSRPNRWRVHARGAAKIRVSYRLLCDQRSVTTNWVSRDLGVLNGAATYLTVREEEPRPHIVRLERPARWKQASTALSPAPGGGPSDYEAPDYDTLVDSPIVAGDLDLHEFEVDGRRHQLVDVGARGSWDGARAAQELESMVRAAARLWGVLPFDRYVFLNVFREGGGGLEHRDSTLLTANVARTDTAAGYRRWVEFATHEYLHAWNAKRLRPVELGPFDYENPPRTKSLWISEGLTNYYADLVLARAGLRSSQDVLSSLSGQIESLQKQPGRLLQTVEQSSEEVWANSLSGINPSESTVSYYVKGHVLGFLLDVRIRRVTNGARSLDDVMRLAYGRFAQGRGFTAREFQATAEEVAGTELSSWFRQAVASTEELDYTEALAWFGLRFAPADGTVRFRIEGRPDAGEEEKARLRAWLEGPA